MRINWFLTCLLLILFSPLLCAQIEFEPQNFPFLDDSSYLRGVSWVDVDNDYDLDVFVSGSGGTFPDIVNTTNLFLNEGNNVFLPSGYIISSQNNPFAHAWADIENDGDLDVYIAATWNSNGINELWLNEDGTGFTLTPNTGATPSVPQPYEGTVSWGDFDNDGFVDLILARWNDGANRLYHNEGDGTFNLVNSSPVTTDVAWTSACIWGDYDNDRDLDLFVANYQNGATDPGINKLYQNDGNGNFTEVTNAGDIITDAANTRSANWIDANNDGFLDLFAANQAAAGDGTDKLYLNNGDGTFTSQNIGANTTTWAANWGDFDNDGDLDLFTCGFWGNENRLWQNDGEANFTDVSSQYDGQIFPLPTSGSLSNGAIFVDYDNDGWLDLHLTKPANLEDYFFRNKGADCIAWLKIACKGAESNRAGIGAKVRVKTEINGQPNWQVRHVSSQNSKTGQNPLWLHFGLSDALLIDSLIVEWPSGKDCIFTDVDINQFIELEEGNCSSNVIISPLSGIGKNISISLCNFEQDTLLASLTSPGGNWSADCGNCIDENGLFAASSLEDGYYQVYNTFDGFCNSTITDTFSIFIGNVNAGNVDDLSLSRCEGVETLDLFPLLQGNPYDDGFWLDSTLNPILMPADVSQEGPIDFYYIDTAGTCADTTFFTLGYDPAPDVDITSDTTINQFESLQLFVSGGVSYEWNPEENLSCSDCDDPEFNGSESTLFTVTVSGNSGCTAEAVVNVEVQEQSGIQVPDLFTPNGDGTNDFLSLIFTGEAVVRSYQIFNRFGQAVAEGSASQSFTDGARLWDGGDFPADVYAYRIEVKRPNEADFKQLIGEILLIR